MYRPPATTTIYAFKRTAPRSDLNSHDLHISLVVVVIVVWYHTNQTGKCALRTLHLACTTSQKQQSAHWFIRCTNKLRLIYSYRYANDVGAASDMVVRRACLSSLAYLQTSEVYGRRRTNHTITSFILANHHQSDKHLGWLMCGNLVIGVPESPLCRGRSWCPSTTNQHRRRNSDDDGTEAPRKWSEKHCSALSGSTLFRVEIYKPRFYWYFLGTPWNVLCSSFQRPFGSGRCFYVPTRAGTYKRIESSLGCPRPISIACWSDLVWVSVCFLMHDCSSLRNGRAGSVSCFNNDCWKVQHCLFLE